MNWALGSRIKQLKAHAIPLGMLIVAQLLVYRQFIFLDRSGAPSLILHWDFTSQYYPWLVYASDVIHAGAWPLWCPYVGGGDPFFINPQTQIDSPLSILVAATCGYSQYVAQLQTFLFVFVAGLGAYVLSWRLFQSRFGALITALSFSLSAAVYGNFEHSTYVNAYGLMPLVFWLIIKLVQDDAAWSGPGLAVLIGLDVVMGYPAVVAMTLTWGAIWAIFLLWQERKVRLRKSATLILACILALGLSAVDWFPVLYYHSLFTRGAPLPIEIALGRGSLSLKHLWELVFQFLTVFPLPGKNPDVAMRGLYVGIMALPLAGVGAAWRRNRYSWALLAFSVLTFCMACGSNFAGRVWLHHLLPILNFSRFPAGDSRTLFALGLCLLAGRGLQQLTTREKGALHLAGGTGLVLAIMLTSGFFWLPRLMAGELSTGRVDAYIAISLALLAAGLPLLGRLDRRWGQGMLFCLVLLDLAIALKINVRVAGEAPQNYRALVAAHHTTFETRYARLPRMPGWRTSLQAIGSCEPANIGYLDKHFYLGDYNPLRLRALDHLDKLGLTNWMLNGPRLVTFPSDDGPKNAADFLRRAAAPKFQVLEYRPNEVDYSIKVKELSLVVFNEIYFPGWMVSEGTQEKPMRRVLGGLRGAMLEPGVHLIRTKFAPPAFLLGLKITTASVVALLFWLGFLAMPPNKKRATLRAPEHQDAY